MMKCSGIFNTYTKKKRLKKREIDKPLYNVTLKFVFYNRGYFPIAVLVLFYSILYYFD